MRLYKFRKYDSNAWVMCNVQESKHFTYRVGNKDAFEAIFLNREKHDNKELTVEEADILRIRIPTMDILQQKHWYNFTSDQAHIIAKMLISAKFDEEVEMTLIEALTSPDEYTRRQAKEKRDAEVLEERSKEAKTGTKSPEDE